MLVNERNKWRDAFRRGAKVGMPYLDEYRENRDSDSWRMGKGGYRMVVLTVDKKKIYRNVHRLVAEAFLPNPDNKREVNHIDGNKLNNNLANLEWATRRENQLHATREGLITYKINMNDAINIRKLNMEGVSRKSLGDMYKLGKTQIDYIINNKRWIEE